MNKPLTPGEILDICGLRLTKPQVEAAARALRTLGYACDVVDDRHIVAFPKDGKPEETTPDYDAA